MAAKLVRRISQLSAIAVALSVGAFAQYGGGGGGTGGGTAGGGGTYSSSGGYSHGAAIGAAAAAAGGGAVLAYMLTHQAAVVGCVQSGPSGLSVVNEKDKKTYALSGEPLTAGERVALKGKKIKDKSGNLSFEVKKIAKNYGSCK